MKRLWLVLVLVLLLVAAVVLIGGRCDDDDDEIVDEGGTVPPGACDQNTAPELAAAVWYLDSQFESGAATFAEYSPAQVYLAFDDAECNLGGGEIAYWVDDEDPTTKKIATDISCSGDAENQLLGFEVTASGEGAHTLSIQVFDRCETQSNVVELDFSLTAYQPPTDDDDDTAGDDDTAATTTMLSGEIDYVGDQTELADRPVYILLYTEWLPDTAVVPAGFVQVLVPEDGFPFAYEWDLDAAEVAAGEYYVFSFLDLADEDGLFNVEVDPVDAPYVATTITEGEATTVNLTLVTPVR